MRPRRWVESIAAGDADLRERQLQSFSLVWLLVILVQHLSKLIGPSSAGNTLAGLGAVSVVALAVLFAVAVVLEESRRGIVAIVALMHVPVFLGTWPLTANHVFLQGVVCALLAALSWKDPDESRLLMGSLCVVAVIVLFYSGLQKLAHGYWFRGQTLAHLIAQKSTYYAVFEPFLSPAEKEALAATATGRGPGPYLVGHPVLLMLSNIVWITEMALAPLLLWARTRAAAMVVTITFLVGVEVLARELFFGVAFVALILLFGGKDYGRRWLVLAVALFSVLVLSRLGFLPAITFY